MKDLPVIADRGVWFSKKTTITSFHIRIPPIQFEKAANQKMADVKCLSKRKNSKNVKTERQPNWRIVPTQAHWKLLQPIYVFGALY